MSHSPCRTDVDVLKAQSGSPLIGKQEHCYMDPQLASACGVGEGDQVRLKRDSSNYALFTVKQFEENGTDDDDVRMALDARRKLGTDDAMQNIDLYTPADSVWTGKSEQWLQNNDECGEFLDETNSTHTDLVVCAAHGGSMETRTDEQVERVYDRLVNTHSKNATSWRCKGFRAGGGAFDRWHITSAEISRNTFTLLDQIADRGFQNCASFHGYTDSGKKIKIGGGCSDTIKQDLKTHMDSALSGLGIDIAVLGANDPLNGDDPANFCNWLTANGTGGIQLEQSWDARVNHWEAIADAVADFLATLV